MGVKQASSCRGPEMRNETQQVTGNGAVGPREEETHLEHKLITV